MNETQSTKVRKNLFSVQNLIIFVLLAVIVAGGYFLLWQPKGKKVSVEEFSPSGETPQTTNITVTFSRDVASDSLLNKKLEKSPFEFSPQLPGEARWITANQLRFYPDVLLAPSTEYRARIARKFLSAYGFFLSGENEFRFHTPRFRVNSGYVNFEYNRESPNTASLFCTVEFNYEVDPGEARDFIRLAYKDDGQIPFTMISTQPGKIINFEAAGVTRGKVPTDISLTIESGLSCIGGNLPMEKAYTRQATIPGQEELKVVRTLPRQTSPKTRLIEVQFNLPVDAKKVQQYIQVDPPLPYRVSSTHHYLRLTGDFKAGQTYQVTLRKGLPAVDGTILEQTVSNAVSFRKEKIPPQVDFVGEGFYLTKSGHLNVGLSTINVDQVNISVEKVYANNLLYLLNTNDLARDRYGYVNLPMLGKHIKDADLTIQTVENQEVVTPINIREYLSEKRKGIYKITARMRNERWRMASKWVVATDMGMVAKKSGDNLLVWVNTLAELSPVAHAELKLISRNNQILMNAQTDKNGIAVFEGYRALQEEGFTPYVITASAGDDLTFLELQRRRIPTTDFDVGGKPTLRHGYAAFLYSDRGVYRPGESAHLVAVVRGEHTAVPPAFPVILRVTTPENKILEEQKATLNEQGGQEFQVDFPDYAKTGVYRARLMVGDKQEIGSYTFNVEEFIPDRMKVKAITDKTSYFSGEAVHLTVNAVTLFGPPAANRTVQTDVELEHFPFSPPQWKSFQFNDYRKKFSRQILQLPDSKLDAQGNFVYIYNIPKNLEPPSALRAIFSATVLEPGGRGVSAYASAIIHPYKNYVGLRKAEEGYAKPGEQTKIEFVNVDPDGNPVSGENLQVSFYRITWQSILKRVSGRGGYRYVSERVEDLVRKFTVTSEEGTGHFTVLPEDYGRYMVVVQNPESGASASLYFYASGWGYSPWAMEHPDRIEIDLDKGVYFPGDKATVQVRAPFAGKMLLTVERDKVLHYRVVELTENTATLELPIEADYKPNVYVSAHIIQATEKLERDTPARAFGVVPLMVSTEENRLDMQLEAPGEIRPESKLQVRLQIHGFRKARPFVTLAAVDEGICQLTDFRTPDPHAYFYGKKRLAVESFDIYGVVLPEISQSSLTSVGGDVEAERKRQLTPVSVTRVKPVALWSGLLQTDKKGRATVALDVPQFNGQLRLMAVAFAGDKFGSRHKKVYVREPIVMTPTFPRFLSSQDAFTVPVSVYNGTGKDGQFDVSLEVEGPVEHKGAARRSIKIPAGTERQVYFDLQAREAAGKVTFSLSATGNGERSTMTTEVPLRPPVPFITLSGAGAVTEKNPQRFIFPADWLGDTAGFRLVVSSFPAIQFSASLQYLLHYPYGCVEQTTSTLLPLLVFNDIARLAEPDLFQRNSADYYIEEGIKRLENMQLASGAFSYWPTGNYINNWSSVYAAHFLVEARKRGYTVSERVYRNLLNALQSASRSYQIDDRYSLQTAVYACYVLALAEKADRSTLLYFKNNALDKLSQSSQFQLAGAFALSGDLQSARSLLPKSVVPLRPEDRQSGRNFNSPIRSQAIMLDILAETDANHPMVPVLVKNLMAAAQKFGRWRTTQENAFAFLALGKILQKQSDSNYTATVDIGGQATTLAGDSREFKAKDWAGKEVSISLQGKGTCYYYWSAEGVPLKRHLNEVDNDLQVRRRFLDKNGNPVPGNVFKQGDLVVAEISVKAPVENLENVAIVDMLPAGLEIENPRLQSRKGVEWLGKQTYHPQYMDIRDDRLIIFGDVFRGRTAKFYYSLRVVTRGTFILPPIRGEAMYAPEKSSVASSGTVVVKGL